MDLMLAFLKHDVSEKFLITDYRNSNKYILAKQVCKLEGLKMMLSM